MKKRVLLGIVAVFTLLCVTGCKSAYEKNDTKLNNISFNAPKEFIEMKKSDGKMSVNSKKKWLSYRYTYDDYSIKALWREADTYKAFGKDSGLKFVDKKINGVNTHFSEEDNYMYTLIEYKDDLYIFEYYGKKTDEGKKVYNDILNSVKYKK